MNVKIKISTTFGGKKLIVIILKKLKFDLVFTVVFLSTKESTLHYNPKKNTPLRFLKKNFIHF